MRVPTETRRDRHTVPRHTCSNLYGTTDTQTHPSSASTSAQAQKLTCSKSPLSNTRDMARSKPGAPRSVKTRTYRQKEVNKEHTNAH